MEFYPDQHFGNKSYSQHGDDFMILNLFSLIGIETPSYLDLGAHHPFIISNTALLYERGSTGINIEANPYLMEEFYKHRPKDKNINVGVGTTSGLVKFYMYSNTCGRNTFSPQEVKSLEGTLSVQKTLDVPVKTLPEIIREYCDGRFPDFLSCDIEGYDYEVLSHMIFSVCAYKTLIGSKLDFLPKLVCVETRKHETERMKEMMESNGFHIYCRMGENLFFIRKDLIKYVY